MAQDHNDIYSIVERLRILEEGLDKNQKSVNQLGATFKPKTVAVLTSKKDPKNPMAGKLVGSDESVEKESTMLEAEVAEDVIEKVKNSFKDFIKQAEEEIKDLDIKEKKKEDTDLKSKDKTDRDLIAKANPVTEDPTQQELPGTTMSTGPTINPTYGESAPVKTVTLTDGMICEIHGNERDGFEIRRGAKAMPTRFKDLSQAEMALEMYRARMKQADESQDYMEEK
jgi:Mg2+ and Co2+ transporter CorA